MQAATLIDRERARVAERAVMIDALGERLVAKEDDVARARQRVEARASALKRRGVALALAQEQLVADQEALATTQASVTAAERALDERAERLVCVCVWWR